MKATNSYVFIPKKEEIEEKVIKLKHGIPYLFEERFNINENQMLLREAANNPKRFSKEIIDRNTRIIRGTFEHKTKDNSANIEFKISNADGVFYLDITINDKKKKIIDILSDMNNILITEDRFTKDYIPIITYDFVSEEYCNALYPKLNRFERSFRKLLFLIFTSQFKEMYFLATAREDIIKKTKETIKKKNEDYRIQNYFYSVDMGTLRDFLFEENWTKYEEDQKKRILEKDISNVSAEEIKKEIESIKPKSNWERFFQNKGFPDNIDQIIKDINNLRNIVAHNKIMSYEQYKSLDNHLKEIMKSVKKAITITEQEDFKNINSTKLLRTYEDMQRHIGEMLTSITKSLDYSHLYETINKALGNVNEQRIQMIDAINEAIKKL